MSTVSITRRPIPVAAAAAAAVAVLAFAGVMVAQDDAGSPASGTSSNTGTQTGHHDRFQPTTSGGRIQPSLP